MANFLSDTWDAVTGQQTVPQQTIIGTGDLLNQTYGALTAAAPGVIAYNQALAPGLMNVQLGVEKQYDPNIGALREATSRSIMNELALGGQLPPDVQQQVLQNALEGATASGFGASAGGRGLVARDLGLTSLDLASRRRAEAAGYTRTSPSLSSLYSPDRGMSGEAVSGDIRQVQGARDELANVTENIRRQNFASLLNTGGRILGTVAGGIAGYYTGDVAGGAAAGGEIGGSLIKGSSVGGYGGAARASGGGGGFMSMIGGMAGSRGGRFQSGTGGRPDSVTAGSVPFNGAFMGSGPY